MPTDPFASDDQACGASGDDAAALRARLEQVRRESAERIAELEARLERSRNVLPAQRDPGAVTRNLAVQQTIDALRNALREKERTIESLNGQVRSLEDRLEDHYQELDSLQRKLDRREHERTAADTRAPAGGGRPAAAPQPPSVLDVPPPPEPTELPRHRQPRGARPASPPPLQPAAVSADDGGGLGTLLAGLAVGLLMSVAAAGGLWWSGWWPPPRSAGAPLWPLAGSGQFPDAAGPAVPDAAGAGAGDKLKSAGPDIAVQAGESAPGAPPAEQDPVRGLVQDGGGPPMVALRPAGFRMGGSAADPTSDARPVHRVTLDAFLIGTHEVTFDEYDAYVRATGARRPSDFGHGRGRQPVVDVSWPDAVSYIGWLSRRTGHRYRLPTEAEWEYAARGGTVTAYWWGVAPMHGRAVCFDCGTRWDRRGPAPVGSFPANPFGLHDTAGNVAEWVADCYRPGYRNAPADGRALEMSGCAERVARGGSWRTPVRSLRSGRRGSFPPDTRNAMIGFRVARDG